MINNILNFFLFYFQQKKPDNHKRILNALQTLTVLLMSIFKKSSISAESGFDIINTLFGFEEADEKMKLLVNHCNDFLLSK